MLPRPDPEASNSLKPHTPAGESSQRESTTMAGGGGAIVTSSPNSRNLPRLAQEAWRHWKRMPRICPRHNPPEPVLPHTAGMWPKRANARVQSYALPHAPHLDRDRSHLCIVVLEHQASAEKLRGPYRPSSVDRQPLAKRTTIAWQRYENDTSFSALVQLPLADKLVHLAGDRMMQYLQRANRDQGQVGAFPDAHVDRRQRHGMRQWKAKAKSARRVYARRERPVKTCARPHSNDMCKLPQTRNEDRCLNAHRHLKTHAAPRRPHRLECESTAVDPCPNWHRRKGKRGRADMTIRMAKPTELRGASRASLNTTDASLDTRW